MATHWTDKRASVAMVGGELARRGWKLYGWKADQSDSMTDYYDPESWDGVAERDGVLVCVDVSGTRDSGGRERVRYVPGEVCGRCNGAKADPSGEMYDPEKRGSPIPYFGACANSPDVPEDAPELRGRLVCRDCNGRGTLLKSETYVEPWPTFQANPAGKVWHVERDGRIVASGVGVFAVASERHSGQHRMPAGLQGSDDATCSECGATGLAGVLYREDCPKARPKLRALVDRIEAAAFPPRTCGCPGEGQHAVGCRHAAEASIAETLAHAPAAGATIGAGTRPGYVELRFPAKPSTEIRDELKGAGFRWAKSGCWYGLATRLPGRYQSDGFKAERARLDAAHDYHREPPMLRDPGEDALDRWNEVTP